MQTHEIILELRKNKDALSHAAANRLEELEEKTHRHTDFTLRSILGTSLDKSTVRKASQYLCGYRGDAFDEAVAVLLVGILEKVCLKELE